MAVLENVIDALDLLAPYPLLLSFIFQFWLICYINNLYTFNFLVDEFSLLLSRYLNTPFILRNCSVTLEELHFIPTLLLLLLLFT